MCLAEFMYVCIFKGEYGGGRCDSNNTCRPHNQPCNKYLLSEAYNLHIFRLANVEHAIL